jgi:hypothetical protein
MADPGYLSNAELAAQVVALVQKYNLFTGEQMEWLTSTSSTTTVHSPDGDVVTVPTLSALTGDFSKTEALKIELDTALDTFRMQGLSYDINVYDKAPSGELTYVSPVVAMYTPPTFVDWKILISAPSSDLVITLFKTTPVSKVSFGTITMVAGVPTWAVTPHSVSVNDAISLEVTSGGCSKVVLTIRYSLIDWTTP